MSSVSGAERVLPSTCAAAAPLLPFLPSGAGGRDGLLPHARSGAGLTSQLDHTGYLHSGEEGGGGEGRGRGGGRGRGEGKGACVSRSTLVSIRSYIRTYIVNTFHMHVKCVDNGRD